MLKTLIVIGTAVLTAALGQASTFTPSGANDLTLTVLSLNADNSVQGYNLSGTAAGTVDGLANVEYLTDGLPLGITPPSPNIYLILINQALTENGVLTLGIPTVGGVGLQQSATFAANTAITDPGILALTSGTISFDWSLTGSQAGTDTTLSTWALADVTSTGGGTVVPEPASMVLMGLGSVGLALLSRRRTIRNH